MLAEFLQRGREDFVFYLTDAELENIDLSQSKTLEARITATDGRNMSIDVKLRYSSLRLPSRTGLSVYDHLGNDSRFYAAFLDEHGVKELRANGEVEYKGKEFTAKAKMTRSK